MFSMLLYGLSGALVVYIIISIAKVRKFRIDNAIALLALIGSIIIAQNVPPPSWPPIFNQGKLVFNEDFNDGVANGLISSVLDMDIVDINKTDKALQVTNNSETDWRHFYFEKQNITNGMIEYSLNLTDYNLSLGNGSGMVAFHFRSTPEERRYLLAVIPENQSLSLNYQGLDAKDGWVPLTKSTSVFNLGKNTWHKIKIGLVGSNITVYLDNVEVLSTCDDRLATGEIFFGIAASTTVLIDDIRVWAKP